MWLKHFVTRGWWFLDHFGVTLRKLFLAFSEVGEKGLAVAGWLLIGRRCWQRILGDDENVLELETGHHFTVVSKHVNH